MYIDPRPRDYQFPHCLTDLLGQELLQKLPKKTLYWASTYFANSFTVEMAQKRGGIFRGTDDGARHFLVLLVESKTTKKTDLVVLYQLKYARNSQERELIYHHSFQQLSSTDPRLHDGDLVMTTEQFAAIREILKGTHIDLRLKTDDKS